MMRECGLRTGACHPHNSKAPSFRPAFDSNTRGCLAGTGFCFISHTGRVQGCGYFDLEAGNILQENFAFVWYNSPLFNSLRDVNNLKGKCGKCEYKRICGGCRARAYEAAGDYLADKPYCIYQPQNSRGRINGHVPG